MRRLLATLLFLTATTTMASTATNVTEHWQPHNADSTATIDHSAFTTFLDKYLVKRDGAPNLVRYAAVTPADHKALEGYIRYLTRIPVGKYNRNEQLAYWLNL